MPDVISNTSCLIGLSNIGRLDILQKRYGHIIITPEVCQEFGESLPEWVSIKAVKDTYKTILINQYLDIGESSTIALAGEIGDSLVILDDGKARRYAKKIGLRITGTLGIIKKVYDLHLINDDISTIIENLHDVNFRIPKDIEERFCNDS
jgi:predicted nucleic acid-binding protein